jgi:hypothetical protein
VLLRASGEAGNGTGIPEGTKVKVTAEVKVFHAPKRAEGLDLQGKQGVVVKNVNYHKGKHLSANAPYKVQIDLEDGGKGKFFVHLVSVRQRAVAADGGCGGALSCVCSPIISACG